MARDIDKKKTRKALRKLRKARDRAEIDGGPGLTDWEKEFVDGVEERLETYGSAFNDPEKGALDEALSARQTQIVRQIDKKARGKGMKRSGFKSKSPQPTPNSRDIREDAPVELRIATTTPDSEKQAPQAPCEQPRLRVISGGKS